MKDINLNIKQNFDNRIYEIVKNLNIIHEDENLKISYLNNNNNNKNILIIFSYSSIENRENVSFYMKKDFNIIYVVDKKNSWFNQFSPDFVKEKILKTIKDKDVYMLGQSMGGFMAIIFSNYIDSKNCICISPQYSIDRETIFVKNKNKYFKNLNNQNNTKKVFLNKTTKYKIIFTDDDEDIEQCELLNNVKNNFNVQTLIFQGYQHDTFLEELKVSHPISYFIEYFIKTNSLYKIKNINIFKSFKILEV